MLQLGIAEDLYFATDPHSDPLAQEVFKKIDPTFLAFDDRIVIDVRVADEDVVRVSWNKSHTPTSWVEGLESEAAPARSGTLDAVKIGVLNPRLIAADEVEKTRD